MNCKHCNRTIELNTEQAYWTGAEEYFHPDLVDGSTDQPNTGVSCGRGADTDAEPIAEQLLEKQLAECKRVWEKSRAHSSRLQIVLEQIANPDQKLLNTSAHALQEMARTGLKAEIAGSAETGGEKADFEKMLGNLLARIHRDGGHYIYDHGWEKAVEDADKKIVEWLVLAESREPEKLNNAYNWIASVTAKICHEFYMTAPNASEQQADKLQQILEVALAESSLSSTPPTEYCTFCGKHRSDELHNAGAELLACSSFTADDYHNFYTPTFRRSSSPMNHGAESAHSGKQNTADKSGLLPTQLPPDK